LGYGRETGSKISRFAKSHRNSGGFFILDNFCDFVQPLHVIKKAAKWQPCSGGLSGIAVEHFATILTFFESLK
jgi:hypothetical protein